MPFVKERWTFWTLQVMTDPDGECIGQLQLSVRWYHHISSRWWWPGGLEEAAGTLQEPPLACCPAARRTRFAPAMVRAGKNDSQAEDSPLSKGVVACILIWEEQRHSEHSVHSVRLDEQLLISAPFNSSSERNAQWPALQQGSLRSLAVFKSHNTQCVTFLGEFTV